MKSISKILVVITVLLSSINTFAQIKNTKTETVKIYGACDMCKSTIDKAGSINNIAKVEWHVDTKMATLTYDVTKTNPEEILKRIALVGYDSESFLAPADVYEKLPECCQYTRPLTQEDKISETANKGAHTDHLSTDNSKNKSQLQVIFDSYYAVKDALIKTDGTSASKQATALLAVIKAVEMDKLATEEHTIWMNVISELTTNTDAIAKSKSAPKQREIFVNLSENMYALAKVAKLDGPVYYQKCPMFNSGTGAHWLSKDSAIKNPYFGSNMLTCGSTVETLNQ